MRLRVTFGGHSVDSTQKQSNIYDVARLAKVSHQTVSRVLNNSTSIRPETKSRVMSAMESLGYRPNQAARALASHKTQMLGILASDTHHSGPASMVHFMELAARSEGFFVVTCGIDPGNPASVKEGIEHLLKLGIGGLAVVTPHLEAVAEVRRQVSGIPVVTLDSMYQMDELAVSVDNFAGGASATQHLIDLGHRNIVHVSGPLNWFESSARSAGYSSTMLNANLSPQIINGDWSLQTGYRVGNELDINRRDVTAVFLANDRMAIGLLRSMRERGIEVPSRLSVVGFDDLEESEFCWPPLTTVRQDFLELGSRAMKLLLDELSGNHLKKLDRLVPNLVIRESTASAATL
jgi:DNA-binding LacI/PurR family transcriptional regulator